MKFYCKCARLPLQCSGCISKNKDEFLGEVLVFFLKTNVLMVTLISVDVMGSPKVFKYSARCRNECHRII